MSFSSDVKNELARQYGKGRHCQLAELAGILSMNGRYKDGLIRMETDNNLLFEKYAVLLQKAFSLDMSKTVDEENSARIVSALRLEESGHVDELILQRTCCKRAFLRGAFMTAGSISDPTKSYHFEIVCRTMEQALQLQKQMEAFSAEAKIVERKNHYIVYLKEGSQIVDMLNVMEAYVSLMNLENVRIVKEMRNLVNRKVNCETANINKTVNAAVKQIEDIRKIQSTIGFEELPYTLREMAQLRLDYPDATLKELGEYVDPKIGKSGVNHRLRKLSSIADTLGGQE